MSEREWLVQFDTGSNRAITRGMGEKWPDDVDGKPGPDWVHVREVLNSPELSNSVGQSTKAESLPITSTTTVVGEEEIQNAARKHAEKWCLQSFGEWKFGPSNHYCEGFVGGVNWLNDQRLTVTAERETPFDFKSMPISKLKPEVELELAQTRIAELERELSEARGEQIVDEERANRALDKLQTAVTALEEMIDQGVDTSTTGGMDFVRDTLAKIKETK